MIYDNIKNYPQYYGLGRISDALQFLSMLDLSLKPGKIEMDGDRTFANIIELSSKEEKDCVFEAHRKYIDIHYIISGTEGIGYAKVEKLAASHEFDEMKDIGFYTGMSVGTLFLSTGDFIVLYPGEAHKVAIAHHEPSPILKAVVKIEA